ncbi:MAG: UDP-glucose/GDP-mannose dehydrogenase family protein [bacterium]|nr:UDP-glucose/GDP-mannose dehydrogenase family protein [bacterium]
MKVAVVGTGYVGLVAGTCFADSGNDVICVDNDAGKIRMLRKGRVPIYEPGLEELVKRNSHAGRLVFTTELSEAVRKSEIIFVAVGTPAKEDGSADLSAVFAVAEGIARAMDGYRVIVMKSTVPVGTADRLCERIKGLTKHVFDVVSNPEFMKEGAALEDFLKPERVIVGTASRHAAELLRELYAPFMRTGAAFLVMDNRSAEMSKYASNAMLAARISFMNEVANICERVGADVHHVRLAVGMDSRIGPRFLFPGVGYGGSCFPKDVQALAATARGVGYTPRLIESIEAVNEAQKRVLFEKIREYYKGALRGKRFGVWGLAFKPQTDDMREAPSLVVIECLLRAGAEVVAYDPIAERTARAVLGERIRYGRTPYGVLRGADALVLVTEWNEFRNPDFERMKKMLKEPVIFDGRNQYDLEEMRERGFTYISIGRPAVRQEGAK